MKTIYTEYGGYCSAAFTKSGVVLTLVSDAHELIDLSREVMILAREESPGNNISKHLPEIHRLDATFDGAKYRFKYVMPIYKPVTDIEFNFALREIEIPGTSLNKAISHVISTASEFSHIVRRDWRNPNNLSSSDNWDIILRDPIVVVGSAKLLFSSWRSSKLHLLKQIVQ